MYLWVITISISTWFQTVAWAQPAWLVDIEAKKSSSAVAAAGLCEKLLLSKKIKSFNSEDVEKLFHACSTTDLFFGLTPQQRLKLTNSLMNSVQSIYDLKQKSNYSILQEYARIVERQLPPKDASVVLVDLIKKMKGIKIGNVGTSANFFLLNDEIMNFADFLFARLYTTQACELSERYNLVGNVFPGGNLKLVRNRYLCMRTSIAKGNFTEAIQMGEKLSAELATDSDFIYPFMVTIDLASAYRENLNLEKADFYLNRASEILKNNRREPLEAWLAVETAEVQKRKSIPRVPQQMIDVAHKLYEKRSSPFMNWAHVRKASIFRYSGDFKSAQDALGKVDFNRFKDDDLDLNINLEFLYETLLLAFYNSNRDQWSKALDELKNIIRDPSLLEYYSTLLSPLDVWIKSQSSSDATSAQSLSDAVKNLDKKYGSQHRVAEIKKALQAKGLKF